MGEGRLLELLETARRGALEAGASDVEVSYEGRRRGFARFADSCVTSGGEIEERRTRVRVALGGRIGTHTVASTDSAALIQAARSACALARAQPATEVEVTFGAPWEQDASPSAPRPPGRYLSVADRAAVLSEAFEAAARVHATCSGVLVSGPREVAVLAGRGGPGRYHRTTETALSASWARGDATSYCVWHGRDATDLHPGALFETPLSNLTRRRVMGDPPIGRVDVVLAPPAVAELLEWLAMASFSGRTLVDGSSCLVGRRGEVIMSSAITLRDDPRFPHPSTVVWPFDAEGCTRRPVTFVNRGCAGDPVTDRSSAHQLGQARSTGHAAPLGTEAGMSPLPRNVVLEPGRSSVEQLIGDVGEGLFVTRLHYVNGLLDTRRAVTTGTTRDGVFAIRGGRLAEAVGDVRFNQSLLEALSDVVGVGSELTSVPTVWTEVGAILCPHLALRGLRITDAARAAA